MEPVTNGQVFAAKDAMNRLVNRHDIPARYHVALIRFVKNYNDEYQAVSGARDTIIRKYAKEGEESVQLGSENYEDCMKEILEFLVLPSDWKEKPAQIPGTVNKNGEILDIIFDDVADLILLEPFIEIV